jgi:PAS domain S-box-containing protein
MLILGTDGLVTFCNHAAQQMFGHREPEIVGHTLAALVPTAASWEGLQGKHHSLADGLFDKRHDAYAKKHDGSLFPVEVMLGESGAGVRRTITVVLLDTSERRRLQKEVLEACEREKSHMAAQLHDGLCQEFAGITFQMQSLLLKAQRGDGVKSADVDAINAQFQQTIRRAKGLSHQLDVVDPQPGGLGFALAQLAKYTSDARGVDCVFDDADLSEVSDSTVATHLFRIAQEAVQNAIEHGHAKQIRMLIERTAKSLSLSVCDDGHDLAESGRSRPGIGRSIMNYRAAQIDARLEIQSRAGGGVCVRCTLPN